MHLSLTHLPESLRDLTFASPEFKAENLRLALEDERDCRPVARAMPSWINILSTMSCNLECIMCSHGLFPDHPKSLMTDDVYERVVRELYPFAKTVQFSTYGEPLLTPQMDAKLDDLERYGCKLELVTNATLIDGFTDRLLPLLDLMTFSIDGATPATYDSIRTKASFDAVIGNITRFAERRAERPVNDRPRMNFNYILMKRTVAEAARFVELVHELGGDEVIFNHLVAVHPSMESECLVHEREYANEHMGAARETALRLGVRIQMPPDFVAPPTTNTEAEPPIAHDICKSPTVKCWFLWQRVYILPDGDVTPCCITLVPRFGSMMTQSFWPVWNSETYQTYRERVFTSDPCSPCDTCYLIFRSPDEADAFSRY